MLYAAVYLQNVLHRSGQAMAERLREERGALSAEYVALIVAVTAILAAVAGGPAQAIAKAIGETASKLITEIGK